MRITVIDRGRIGSVATPRPNLRAGMVGRAAAD